MTNNIQNPVTDNVGTGIHKNIFPLILVKVIERNAENEDLSSIAYHSLKALETLPEWTRSHDDYGDEMTWCLDDEVRRVCHASAYETSEEMHENDSDYLYTYRYHADQSITFSDRLKCLMQASSICCLISGSKIVHEFSLIDALIVDGKLFIHQDSVVR